MKRPGAVRLSAVLCLCSALAVPALAQQSPLSWLNALRAAAGAPPVQPDDLLSHTAAQWAQSLARAGILAHRGADGSNALDRYRAQGGTETRVGEIIGAGPDLSAVEKAWEKSNAHRTLALRSYWTHVGWGSAGTVWVVLFCEKLVDSLDVELDGTQFSVRGRFIPANATGARLLAGIVPHGPARWDPVSREFVFQLSRNELPGYLRLGYVTADGGFLLTNVLTSPRGTGSRGE